MNWSILSSQRDIMSANIKFRYLRWLELYRADVQPPHGLALGGSYFFDVQHPAEQEHRQEHEDSHARYGEGQPVEVVIVEGGDEQHGYDPRYGEAPLAHDIVVAVVLPVVAVRIACGEQHHKADGQQHHYKHEQGHVEPLAQAEKLVLYFAPAAALWGGASGLLMVPCGHPL
jgi:hypothetical protein